MSICVCAFLPNINGKLMARQHGYRREATAGKKHCRWLEESFLAKSNKLGEEGSRGKVLVVPEEGKLCDH